MHKKLGIFNKINFFKTTRKNQLVTKAKYIFK